MRLDEADYRLLALLTENARLSYRQLAEATGLSTPTVSAKVRAMEEMGLIRGYRVVVDREKLGETQVVVTLKGRPSDLPRIAERVGALDGCREVLLLSGASVLARFDLRAPGRLSVLLTALMDVPEIADYSYAEVLRTVKAEEASVVPPGASVAIPCHQCKGPIHGEPVRGTHGGRTHYFCCRGCSGAFAKRYEALSGA